MGEQATTNQPDGIPPGALQPGEVVEVAGLPGRFAVMDCTRDSALVELQAQNGARLRVGWRGLRWPGEATNG